MTKEEKIKVELLKEAVLIWQEKCFNLESRMYSAIHATKSKEDIALHKLNRKIDRLTGVTKHTTTGEKEEIRWKFFEFEVTE